MKKVLLTATVQSHICQFHKPLVEVLHELGYEVHVAAKDNLAEKNGLKLDFVDEIYDVPFSRSPKSLDNIKAYKRLKNIIDNGSYEIIHCNTPMGGIVTRLAAIKARKNGSKVFYTAHGFHFYKGAPKKNWLFFYPIEKLFSRITDKLITITNEDYTLAQAKFHCDVYRIHGVGVDEKRYFSVCDDIKAQMREEMGFHRDQKILLCVGELLPNKNQVMAIRMMSLVTQDKEDVVLLIAGNGPEKDNLEKLVVDLGLEKKVFFLGYVTNIQDYQHIADILISCSKREGLPLNVIEAMLSSTAVVVTKNRGHEELVENGVTGFVVDFDNEKEMSERVRKLLTDRFVYQEVEKNAKKFADNYSANVVRNELRGIYRN